MSKLRNNKKCYLTDPHLFYHLESPVKITQLLQSGLYMLHGNNLISHETKQKIQISSYTLGQVPTSIKQKYNQNQCKRTEIPSELILNPSMKLSSRRSQESLEKRKQNTARMGSEFGNIKGLKQFKAKIL